MQISSDLVQETLIERDVYERILPLDGARILELGCGAGLHTRNIAAAGANRQVIAYEVDTIQYEKNLRNEEQKNIKFKYGGAEAIAEDSESVDIVMMFKSLHHVPTDKMSVALEEIRRVLKPGGLAYISEPVFAGDFNEVLRLFHDEQKVRECAFKAIKKAVEDGLLYLEQQIFFQSLMHFDNFEELERTVINATHSEHHLTPATYHAVKAAFEEHMTGEGANFLAPMRVDILHKNH